MVCVANISICAIKSPFILNFTNDYMKLSATYLTQFYFMLVHIGKKIKQEFNGKGMTISEFGRRINKSRENVYDIFKRKTIDTALLLIISKVLEHDFFQYYTPLKNEVSKLKKENSVLKEMNSFLLSKRK
jgi:hypothetical protein